LFLTAIARKRVQSNGLFGRYTNILPGFSWRDSGEQFPGDFRCVISAIYSVKSFPGYEELCGGQCSYGLPPMGIFLAGNWYFPARWRN